MVDDRKWMNAEAGEQHCIEIEPVDPRFKEGTEAIQAIVEELGNLGWAYGETRDERTILTQRFVSEQAFLEAFSVASVAVGSRAVLQEVPCNSAYNS